jgi:hypothetical protein
VSQLLVEVYQAQPKVAQRVQKWFADNPKLVILDGSRSIRVPHPEKYGKVLKIKGAGFMGEASRFGVHHRTGPHSTTFDFDGRRMQDIASGHNNAFLGAASFQQAAVEFATSQKLASLGYSVVPCIGYGRVQQGDHVSWFSLFEYEKDWINVDESLEANIENGRLIVELAVKHNLVGYFWYIQAQKGQWLLKDLHPFREVSPLNMSQISWVLQVIAALYTRCWACRHFGAGLDMPIDPDELASIPLKGILADASAQDYRDLKLNIVQPYIQRDPHDFSINRLFDSLCASRVGQVLLDICPDTYARWHECGKQ